MRLLLPVVIILCLGSSIIQGQSEQSKINNIQQDTYSKQRGSENSPFVIKILPTNNHNEESSITKQERQPQEKKGWNLSDKIAGISIGVGFLQFIALIGTIFVMMKNSRQQLRAYVLQDSTFIIDGTMLNPPQLVHANEPGIAVSLRNSGQSPAYKVISWAKVDIIAPLNENQLVVPPLNDVFSNTLGTGQTFSKAIWYGRQMTAAEIVDVGTGVKRIYLYGRVEYRDIFNRKHYSNFRLFYSGIFPPILNSLLNFSEHGNEAS
ncbi:MAG: hypothetical protein HY342_10165 [Candidatus Lambdaproteobacteria bacterium]|nr:hypothetical protein [Candidatus Lambdaproteobacteria bacterium]